MKKNREKRHRPFLSTLLSISLSVFLLSGLGSATAQAAGVEWKLLTSWGPSDNLATRIALLPWIDRINKELAGKLHISWVGPESVPPFEQLKPLRNGIFDVLYTHPAYHAGDIAVGMGIDLFDFPSKEKRAVGVFDILDEAYKTTQGVRYLGGFPGAGYHIVLRDKCISTANLKGYKIRSNPFYDPLLKALGAASVTTPITEVFSALEKGVVDGACQPATDTITLKWYEVAKYRITPTFGATTQSLFVNEQSWNRLPKDVQDAVVKITKEVEDSSYMEMRAAWAKQAEQLKTFGMQECALPKEEAKKYLDTFYEETWKYVIKLDPKYGPPLKAAADKLQKK